MDKSIINVISIGIMLVSVFVFLQKHKSDLGYSKKILSSLILLASLTAGGLLIWVFLKWLIFIMGMDIDIPFGCIYLTQLMTSVLLFFSVSRVIADNLTLKIVCKNFIFILYMELILSNFWLSLYFAWFFSFSEGLLFNIFINGVAIALLIFGLHLLGEFIEEKIYNYTGTSERHKTVVDINHSQDEDTYHYSDEYTSGYTAGRDAASSNTESTHDDTYSSYDCGYNDGVDDYE